MANPSKADAENDDPTLTRITNHATGWGFGELVVVNTYAYVSTEPAGLHDTADPVGPCNDTCIRQEAAEATCIVAAWGNVTLGLPRALERIAAVTDLLVRSGKPVMIYGLTQQGQPVHPLYQPCTAAMQRWRP